MGDLLRVIILGIVEGVTEFLPVSSTGHLLLCEQWMGLDLQGDPFWKMFTVFIQIGAIAAVVVYFRERILRLLARRPAGAGRMTPLEAAGGSHSDPRAHHDAHEVKGPRVSPLVAVVIGTLPVLVIGFALHKWVEKNMEHPLPVALALGIGGLLMIAIEYLRPAPTTRQIEEMTFGQAITIGLAQVLAAVFPGTSRSAATIMGGLVAGLSREAAAEFSFFLAIPSMAAACGYSLLKFVLNGPGLTLQQGLLLLIGTLVSFIVAWGVIAAFMNYVRHRSFVPFAVYRILLCLVVLYYARGAA